VVDEHRVPLSGSRSLVSNGPRGRSWCRLPSPVSSAPFFVAPSRGGLVGISVSVGRL